MLYGVFFAITGYEHVRQDKNNKDSKGCVKLYDCSANQLTELDAKNDTTNQVIVSEKKHDLSMLFDKNSLSIVAISFLRWNKRGI